MVADSVPAYALKVLAVAVVAWSVLNVALLLMFTQAGITLLLFGVFAAVIAAFAGATLLAAGLLFPGALVFAGAPDLLLVLASVATLSALFMVGFEGYLLGMLRRKGVGRAWAETGFAFVHGLATALLLAAAARLVPGVDLATGAALAAGLVGVFGFYLAELVFAYSGPVDAEQMALTDTSFEDREGGL